MENKILQFLNENSLISYSKKEILKVLFYDCLLISMNDQGVQGVCIIEIRKDNIFVRDCVVLNKKNYNTMLKWFAIQALKRFPFVSTFEFERDFKYPGRKPRKYDIYRFIGIRRIKNGK